MQFNNNNYYTAMDHLDNTQVFESDADAPLDAEGNPIVPDEALNFTAREIGATTNPMANTLQSLKEKIMEGASRIEFEFIGQGKGNSQQPTPESFGKRERQDIRELLSINKMKTSTHASVHSQSLAGFGQRGFNDEAKAQALKEIKKAIHFAGEATKGGAIVFHMQEWQRPMSQLKDSTGGQFKAYDEEDQDAVLFAVDKRTGEAVSTISKNREVYRPKYETAKDMGLAGQRDEKGNLLNEDDWIDVRGNLIPKDANVERLFDRVPKFNKDKTNFEVEKLTWDKLVEETNKWNNNHPTKTPREPEEMFAILESENRVLQAKGSSLFYAQNYDEVKHSRDELLKEYSLYKQVRDLTPEEDRSKLKAQFLAKYERKRAEDSPEMFYERMIQDRENQMRHIHEASSSADVQARQYQEVIENIESAKKYGLKRTADTIAKSAIYAMETYNKNKEKYGLEDPIYVAPENWDPKMYGSHPDEYVEAIKAARQRMTQLLVKTHGKSESEAEKIAKSHIKGTLDVGHLNMYREHWEGNPKDFDKWLLNQAERLVKEGYVGHIHLTDNMGFDDEHLTPGQGNVPMKEFLKRMEKAGIKDIIVEPGSYNPKTAMYDTLALVNSPVYSTRRLQRFGQMRDGHFGYNAPGFFIAGAYAPSNEWKTWTGLDLE